MIVETADPGVEGVREAVAGYKERCPEYAEALDMYGAIMEAQQNALADAVCPLPEMDVTEIEARNAMGDPIIDVLALPIDADGYRKVVSEICKAVDAGRPRGFHLCGELSSWEGLSAGRAADTRDAILKGEDPGFEPSGKAGAADLEIVRNILWEGLAPSYRVCGSILATKMEQSSWLRGYCPVCGGAPLMGMFREEDGLWLVECSLCHTMWNLQRAACAFCNDSYGKLDYLYIDDDRSRRVNYCSACKTYVKTVDLRSDQKNRLLPLEDIVTMDLDLAAKEEGLIPASARF